MESNLTIDIIKKELQTMINNTKEETNVVLFLSNLSNFMNAKLEQIKPNNEENDKGNENTGEEVINVEKQAALETDANTEGDATPAAEGEASLETDANAEGEAAPTAEGDAKPAAALETDANAEGDAAPAAEKEAEGEKGNNPENQNIEV